MATASEFTSPRELELPNFSTLASSVSRMEHRVLTCNPGMPGGLFPSRDSKVGKFDVFPVELIFKIFANLDFASLIKFKKANYAAFALVSAYLPFEVAMKHSSETLRAIQSVGTLKFVNASELFEVMRSTKCSQCGNTGPFLFIPLLKRTCWKCIPTFRIYKVSSVKRCFGLDDSHFRNVATFRTIPGTYGVPLRQYDVIQHLISEPGAQQARLEAGHFDQMQSDRRTSLTLALSQYQGYLRSARANLYDLSALPQGRTPTRGPRTWEASINEDTHQYTYLLTTILPFANLAERTIQHPRYCAGCLYERHIFKTQVKRTMSNEVEAERMEIDTLFKASRACYLRTLWTILRSANRSLYSLQNRQSTTLFVRLTNWWHPSVSCFPSSP
ncbi:uncharacterized protein CIMG_02051 [Coccidioides immitis RS]|uniref:F-box domain-containing protein n=1 Tax=Coccidioides immitis (strain RS) TaxID=246410 RepID=J3KKJ0_COCIM|nr:uncharacterized protein CIMG_02051 [Coccidioides immitis RS]EAS36697.3 hypothetical protein CIMG_02051 [Coccidioides immitis RS]